jgi:hypothetical protein
MAESTISEGNRSIHYMPAVSEQQRRAAGRELARRRKGEVKRSKRASRPFAGATLLDLVDFARR